MLPRIVLMAIALFSLSWRAARADEAPAAQASSQPSLSYNRDVRPILSNHCFKCHGPDARERKGELRLDLADESRQPTASGALAIVPGKPDESELVARVFSTDESTVMPPRETQKQLTEIERDVLRRWIAQGAEYQQHWSFLVPQRAELPAVKLTAWPRNAIDRFILARLEQEGLRPSPEADRATLLRRLTFDLTGLPPTPAEVEAFVLDNSADAYEKVVERLLASPHYGERLALDWLDAARFADTNGYHIDNGRDMTHWREWVINSFNRNLPFDQFTVEQLAGDLLPGHAAGALVHMLHRWSGMALTLVLLVLAWQAWRLGRRAVAAWLVALPLLLVVLGLVQGLTEFLPISSSAHLRILGPLLPGGGDPGAAFTAITQLGTELAVLIYFRRDVTRMLLAWWRSLPRLGREALSVDAKVAWLVILGTIPICVLGLLLRDLIETTFRTLLLTAIMLIVFGVILAWAERRGSQTRSIAQLTVKDGVLLGLAQAMALIPGVSRSGGTITVGLLLGLTRDAAARFSFLLAIPAVLLSGFYMLLFKREPMSGEQWAMTLVATGVAFAVGYAVIVWFMRLISTKGFGVFVVYRIVLGSLLLLGLGAGVVQ